jgi:aryl-alcohol dehydrogenase-like predicted oxidoreductase
MSSIGLGTYLGHWDESTDRMYEESVRRAVELGSNVFDSAINYRFQRSERAIGAALKQLFDGGRISRDEVVVATKGGFFPFDGEPPRDPRGWVINNVINTGLAEPDDIVDSHCMSPRYLEDQLNRSLENLGLKTIDIYYIHNPETQLEGVSRPDFVGRLRAAFEFLEKASSEGRIGYYGTATWNGYRQPRDSRDYLSLSEIVGIAREIGGDDHRFRFIQLPYNLSMPEALTFTNQTVANEQLTVLEAAEKLDVTVVCSATLMQARLAAGLPGFIRESLAALTTDAQRAIQFVRSTPGVGTALIGMSRRSHVEENLLLARVPPAAIQEFLAIFPSESEA